MYEIIRKLRKERGLTQQQVAEQLNIERSTYAYYESGRTRMNMNVIVGLAHFYQVSYAVIIGRPEPIFPMK